MNPSPRKPIGAPSRTTVVITAPLLALLLLVGNATACGPDGVPTAQGDIGPSPSQVVAGDPGVPTAPPSPAPTPSMPPQDVVATRIVIKAADIDLPIISGDLPVPNQGPRMYPPCDVALYHTSFGQPGQGRSTYLYAHARDGMFLPLLTAAEKDDGKSLIGARVDVYTSDDRLHVFTITRFKRHSRGFSIVDNAPPGAEQLVLQTSEGPRGTVPKLQVLALPDRVEDATHKAAQPRAHPTACYNG